MTRKADFNAEEWAVLIEGPPLASAVVSAADRGGTVRETVSVAQAYADARQRHGISELFDDLVAESPQVDVRRFGSVDELRRHALQRLRDAVAALERRAQPDEVDGYRRFVSTLAEAVARAHREGGVLGIGGREISDSERAALDEIAVALGHPGA